MSKSRNFKTLFTEKKRNFKTLKESETEHRLAKRPIPYLKFSARRQAFVLESSPPIITSPSKSSFVTVSSACLSWKTIIACNLSYHFSNILCRSRTNLCEHRFWKPINNGWKCKKVHRQRGKYEPVLEFQSCLCHCGSYQTHPIYQQNPNGELEKDTTNSFPIRPRSWALVFTSETNAHALLLFFHNTRFV